MLDQIAARLAPVPMSRLRQIVNTVFGELMGQPWLTDVERRMLVRRK